MNFKNLLFAVLTSVIFTFSGVGNLSHAKETEIKTSTVSISNSARFSGEYSYVRVFKDGIWWIYVYDGSILIDAFPED